jgi:hypothetical protein
MYGSDPFGLSGFNPAPLSGQPLFQPPAQGAISPYHLMAMQQAMQAGQPQQQGGGLLGQAQQGMGLLGGLKGLGLLGGAGAAGPLSYASLLGGGAGTSAALGAAPDFASMLAAGTLAL